MRLILAAAVAFLPMSTMAQSGHACRLSAKECARIYAEIEIIDLHARRDAISAPARLNERQVIDYVVDRKYARMADRMRLLSKPVAAEWKRLNHCDLESRAAARRGERLPDC